MADIRNYKQMRLIEIYDNAYINAFINKYNLTSNIVSDNFVTFDECLSSIELCSKCTGIKNCKQGKKGEIIGLAYDGVVSNTCIYCKQYMFIDNLESLKKSYVYSDIPLFRYDLFMDNISLNEDETKRLFGICYGVYEGENKKGLYLYGTLGVGKTYMCMALANSLVKKGKKVAFIKINDFVTKMSELIREDVNEYERLITSIKKAEYLFIDDIGSEPVTEFSRDRLMFNILDYRMENKLCTFFTSNLDRKALYEHYLKDGDSIKAERILERIEMLSDDYCLKGTNKRRVTQ